MNTALNDRARSLARGIASSNPGTRWDVIGGTGFGKSTMLQSLHPVLKESGYTPILLDPPRRDFDTAASAMSTIVDNLADTNMLAVDPKNFMLPSESWGKKFEAVEKSIAANADKIVLLCDEPMHWSINARDDSRCETYSNYHAREIGKWLQKQLPCRTVIANSRNLFPDHFGQHQLPVVGLNWRDLSLTNLNDTLEILESRIGSGFHSKPYLAMQLLAVFARITNVENALLLNSQLNDVALLGKAILERLRQDQAHHQLLKVLARVSLVRGSLDSELLNVLDADALSNDERSLLVEGCLRRVDDEHYRVHSELERVIPANSILTKDEIAATHKLIANHYETVSQTRRSDQRHAYSVDVEHFFHQAVSGNANWHSSKFYFVDQLHAWGRYLSHDALQHDKAAKVFQRAIELDKSDDYAHHYLAYNFDCIAQHEQLTHDHYQEAINLNPSHPWWWSRWVNFLITTGRMQEAREELTKARIELGLDTGDTPKHTFQAFHKWVIRLLLHRAQLDLAEQLFADVDDDLKTTDVGFIAMQTVLSNLKFTRDGWDVLPVHVDPDRDWRKWPFIDKPGRVRNRTLKEWHPAKVVGISEETVDLLVGKQVENREYRFGRIEIPKTTFLEAVENADPDIVDEGTFVELSFYGDEARLRVDVFKRPQGWMSALPGFDPPNPSRYLEARQVEA